MQRTLLTPGLVLFLSLLCAIIPAVPVHGQETDELPLSGFVTADLCALKPVRLRLYGFQLPEKEERLPSVEKTFLKILRKAEVPVDEASDDTPAPFFNIAAHVTVLDQKCIWRIWSGVREPVTLLRLRTDRKPVYAQTWEGKSSSGVAASAEQCWDRVVANATDMVHFFVERYQDAQQQCERGDAEVTTH